MTSSFATNFVTDRLQRQNFLRVNKEGQPLQGQVALTYQVYSGTGNTTIVYDGSNVLIIDSTLAAGDLTIDFSDTADWLGRKATVIVKQLATSYITFDFGTSNLHIPPVTSVFHTFQWRPVDTPLVAELDFYTTTDVELTNNPTVFAERIEPGAAGQVLTTNAGTGVVDWEAPSAGATAPKSLLFKWDTSALNDINQNTPNLVQWTVDTGNNDTTFTLGSGAGAGLCGDFTVVDPGPITISYDAFIIVDPTISLRGFVAVNSLKYSFSESSLGNTGQKLSGAITVNAVAGDIIGVYIGNASGAVTPVLPADADYGNVSITQYVY